MLKIEETKEKSHQKKSSFSSSFRLKKQRYSKIITYLVYKNKIEQQLDDQLTDS